MTQKRRGANAGCAVLVAALLIWVAGPVRAQTNNKPQLTFLHFRCETNGVWQLLEQTTLPGLLKEPRAGMGTRPLWIELEDDAGKPVWRTTLEDPTWQRFEYPLSDNSGRMGAIWVERSPADVVVRVPFRSEAHQVSLHAAAVPAARTNAASVVSSPGSQRFLGRFPLKRGASK